MTAIGVFGGSFNPIHNGHIRMALAAKRARNLDEVLMILSPLNPFKTADSSLIDDRHRLEMLRIATAKYDGLTACDIELNMPRPNFSVNTLERLRQLYPDAALSLIIGADNALAFHKWHRWNDIIRICDDILVCNRPGNAISKSSLIQGLHIIDAPLLDISSTEIRDMIKKKMPLKGLIDPDVATYISENNLYN